MKGCTMPKDDATLSAASAGSQPVAWAVHYGLDPDPEVYWQYPRHAAESGRIIVPLYSQPQPTLTDKEREAIRWFAEYGDLQSEARRAEVLAALLKRLG
jgi:hypothetical protein